MIQKMENSLAFACQQTFLNTDNSLGLYYGLQTILIAFYVIVGLRAYIMHKNIKGTTELGRNRKNLL